MSVRDELRPGLLAALLGTSQDEAQVIIAALAEVRDLPGSCCEFGVAQGRTSALIANEIRDEATALHLFDSFQGLPAPGERDHLLNDIFSLGSMDAYAGQMSIRRELVESELSAIWFPSDRVVIHDGFIENTLKDVAALPLAVKFSYVDLDFFDGTSDALAWLDNVAVHGAVVVCDDYGFFSSGVKTAVDEFIACADGKWTMEPGEFFAVLSRRSA